MAWLAKLDARAQQWSPTTRRTYAVIKWALVVLGAYALIGSWSMKVADIASWF